MEMKKPNTPVLRRMSHRKKALGWGIVQEAKEPANTIMAESRIMATDMPSTPTARLIFNGANQLQLSVKSMGAVLPVARMAR